jgi:hypothetical protein
MSYRSDSLSRLTVGRLSSTTGSQRHTASRDLFPLPTTCEALFWIVMSSAQEIDKIVLLKVSASRDVY